MIFGLNKKKVDETEVLWHNVQSSFVEAIAYDKNTSELYVTLSHGSYVYSGVPQIIFDEFLESSSKGSFFNRKVKNVYVFTPR